MEPETSVPNTPLHQKLLKVRKAIKAMAKDGYNDFHKYNYLSESQVTESMKELLDAHDILFAYDASITSIRDVPTKSGNSLVTSVDVKCYLIDAVTGQQIISTVPGQGQDAGDKGVYKAVTGAIKYFFMKTFLIPTGDDPERDGTERPPVAPAALPVRSPQPPSRPSGGYVPPRINVPAINQNQHV